MSICFNLNTRARGHCWIKVKAEWSSSSRNSHSCLKHTVALALAGTISRHKLSQSVSRCVSFISFLSHSVLVLIWKVCSSSSHSAPQLTIVNWWKGADDSTEQTSTTTVDKLIELKCQVCWVCCKFRKGSKIGTSWCVQLVLLHFCHWKDDDDDSNPCFLFCFFLSPHFLSEKWKLLLVVWHIWPI